MQIVIEEIVNLKKNQINQFNNQIDSLTKDNILELEDN